ncbi:MAG: hypothetical protein N3E50_08035 [Candidatus Goldbacteria bacterium]|nr:hypothetical protein [Candidatus Goldiibacteriota bacterium]
MKKLFVFLFIISEICYAESIFIYKNLFIPEQVFQVVYREKYFEKTTYYIKYNFWNEYAYINPLYKETLTGLEHNILLRAGLPNNYIINVDFDFLFQRVSSFDYNNLQTIVFFVEKKIELFKIMAGLKIPMKFEMKTSPYLINKRKHLNLFLGIDTDLNFDWFKICFLFLNQENMDIDNYLGTKDIILTLGFDFISNELQKIGFYIENNLKIDVYNNLVSSIYYFIPQIKIDYNDFVLIAGIEFYLHAENVFVNKYDKPLLIFKMNYSVSKGKEEMKEEKKEEKKKFEKKKWWQIEGVDDEMIPQSWKEMEEPRSK